MATLNTLRTRYGIVLSIVIAIVLLAFILGDQLSYRGGNQEIADHLHLSLSVVKQAVRVVSEKSGLPRSEFAAIL